jgi:hypothetical protein
MTTFDDRERAFEAHFALDQELDFKARARRDRRVGEWAGRLMGLEGKALVDYAASIVREDLKEPGDEEVFRKLHNDLTASGINVRDSAIHSEMDRLLAEAREEIKTKG